MIGVEEDGKGSTLVRGNDDLRSTSFYFKNVLEQIPYFLIRKGFRVCAMFLDVFFAKNRNVRGYVYDLFVITMCVMLVTWFGH